MWLQRVAGSPEAKPDPQQIVQRGKDRRATLLQKPGAPDLTKILELDQIDLFEEEKIFCCVTIVFQVMSDCASQ